MRVALEAQRETLGDRHPDTLGSIYNLGMLLAKQGKYDEAEPLLRESLEAHRETLGDRPRGYPRLDQRARRAAEGSGQVQTRRSRHKVEMTLGRNRLDLGDAWRRGMVTHRLATARVLLFRLRASTTSIARR